MRSPYIALVILTFSLLTSVFSNAGFVILPQVNSMATSDLDQNSLSQFTSVQNVTSNDATGNIGYYNNIIKSISTVVSIIVGTAIVGIPLMNLGVPWWIALLLIQPLLYAIILLEQSGFWRGTNVL